MKMIRNSIFLMSIRDFLTPKMLKYSVVPFIVTMIIMYIIFFYVASSFLGQFHEASLHIVQSKTTISNAVEHSSTVVGNYTGSSILTFLMSHVITSWIFAFFFYILGSMLVLVISIFMAIIIISFLTPFVLRELHLRHYQDIQMQGDENILFSFLYIIKIFIITIIFFILLVPLYFIPILNILVLNLPMYYFFHKILTHDIASNIVTKNEYKQIMFFSGNKIRARTLILYLISLIPFAILFGGIFYVIFLGHTYFIEARKLKKTVNN